MHTSGMLHCWVAKWSVLGSACKCGETHHFDQTASRAKDYWYICWRLGCWPGLGEDAWLALGRLLGCPWESVWLPFGRRLAAALCFWGLGCVFVAFLGVKIDGFRATKCGLNMANNGLCSHQACCTVGYPNGPF